MSASGYRGMRSEGERGRGREEIFVKFSDSTNVA
jgi:hypothetical protein